MSRIDDYDDLDFSEDRYADRPKRRVTKAERHKPRRKRSIEFDDYAVYEDNFDSYDDDWNQYVPEDFDYFERH